MLLPARQNRRAVIVANTIIRSLPDMKRELCVGQKGGKKEARFLIQRRWLSVTLSTFDKIITRFAERRRLSRKKLSISYLSSRAAQLCLSGTRVFFPLSLFPFLSLSLFYSLFYLSGKADHAMAHNFPFLHFSSVSVSQFNYSKRAR